MSYYFGGGSMRYAVLVILAATLAGTAAGATQLGSARIAARIVTGNGPCAEGRGCGSLWVSNVRDNTLARIDAATYEVVGKVQVGGQPCGVASGAGAIWVDGFGTSSVERVEPTTMQVVARIPVG